MPIRGPNLFTVPIGVPFLPALARALVDGSLIEGFPGPDLALALPEATIYVPTQRAAAGLAAALVEASRSDSILLPRIAPLGAFEPEESASTLVDLMDGEPAPSGPPLAVGELTRRHALARWVRAWGKALRGAIVRMEPDGSLTFDGRDPPLVASTPAQAYALATDLAALVDDLIIEGVDWRRLETIAPEEHDPYWRITLDFLKIAFSLWPEWLAGRGLVDRASRVAQLIDAEVESLASGARRGPIIIAGSTGANRATARLIAAVAKSPKGAVVLPGLDLSLDRRAWDLIGASAATSGAPGHPQALLHRLMGIIGADREDVRTLGAPRTTLAARGVFVSEALRPADSTDQWRNRDASLSTNSVDSALGGVAIAVAESEAEEALALAIAMRETLETPGKTAALITPSPAIARRVATELARWGIEVENSAGRTLWETEAGALSRLVLDAAIDPSPLATQALLSHASARLGRTRSEFEDARRALELGVFRAIPAAPLVGSDRIFSAAREAAAGPNAHPAARAIDARRREAAERLLLALQGALAPLRERSAQTALKDWLSRHRDALTATLASPEGAAAPHGFEALSNLIEEWTEAAGEDFPCSLSEYAELFSDALLRIRAPAFTSGHPRLQILGLLEARLLSFDRVLLAGLDETVWPPAVDTDAFLNRPMRSALGLSAPERRIGQTAHDFAIAFGAPEAILSRSKKRDGAPTVASRFLQRILAASGASSRAVAEAEQRGNRYLRLARSLDQPAEIRPIRRPEPRPPKKARPTQLSVTRIETLRRDPYSIYAERILALKPLDPVGRELDARDVGEAWHGALEDFLALHPLGPLSAGSRAELIGLTRRRFAALLEDPSFERVTWPNIEKAIDFLFAVEKRRRLEIVRSWTERQGEIAIPLTSGGVFKLTARADRIDALRSGGAAILDYKSGTPPTQKLVASGLSPQLTLEAAILVRGGFGDVGTTKAEDALYLKIGGVDGGKEVHVKSVAALAEKHLGELRILLDQFADETTPYLSRPIPQFASRFAEYDHLARVKEWSASGEDAEADSP